MSQSPSQRPSSLPPVQYKGAPLEAERGPGLGCFWFQVAVLIVLVVLTPLSVGWRWSAETSAALLLLTILLLLVTGQTIIFLLRIVAAERREGRRRPMAAGSMTVGELEDANPASEAGTDAGPGTDAGSRTDAGTDADDDPADRGPMRQ